MRLIDIDPIIKDKETLSNAFEIVMDSMTGKCLIECTVPTVQAVPIDVLDKIRAEIEQDAFKDVDGSKFIFVNRVNQILDKYKAESERVNE